jgi:hypothetical protein
VRIGLIGGNELSPQLYEAAQEVGRLLASAGAEIVCGGMAGAMEAACRGAAQAGGRTIGLLPDETLERANDYVGVPIATGMGYARNYIIVYNSDALIAIGGSEGTLNEMAAALNMGRTVVSLHSWDLEKIGHLRRGRLLPAGSAQEAVTLALKAADDYRGAPARPSRLTL